MGRGRAKAKQTKVARQLKYNSGGFDPTRLADELGVPSTNHEPPVSGNGHGDVNDTDTDRDDDPYADYAEKYNTGPDDDEDA
ncbi:hypothetical protein BIV57_04535 [Mangrovactinospora gilvigrisea]|uniref:DUF3073 domain-containing protein n=1 Tax=Mangrovactinospora gilvigrisea TaxID=1428644 RepID=A0A1J7BJ47_9ACTN|nr:DUF3073 domain-containing protein [Mangrovactinospora gilvigrisea]OIV38662.1 hypothetical protein BIV57_04535 [Mangrovactinospora gilvigrisea]